MRVIVAITGASGAVYGIRALEVLREMGVETDLILSQWGMRTIELETDHTAEEVLALATRCHDRENLAASISSGSCRADAMLVAPCSMKTLSGIAHGYTDNLVVRAADMMLKERRRLVLVTRESPLNLIHIENMRQATLAGAIIMPPVPAMYHRPQTVDELNDHLVGRMLDLLGLPDNPLVSRWEGIEP